MLIRRNTKAFKTIVEIVTACRDRADREALIRLYITRAGDSIAERIAIEGIQGDASLFYDMTYQAVLSNLTSPGHQLHESDDIPGIYFFHSSSNKVWDETPFEFDEAVKKLFGSLPEFPVLRKKEKADKFVFAAPNTSRESKAGEKEQEPAKKSSKKEKKAKGETKKIAKVVNLWPKQPNYQLKHDIHFTGLDKVVYRQPQLTKRDVLDYYNRIAEFLLPYLKDRPQVLNLQRDGQRTHTSLESLAQHSGQDIPDWVQTTRIKEGKRDEQLLLCNDREHLLFYAEMGCVEFYSCHSRIQSLGRPGYIFLSIESPEYQLTKAIGVALSAKEVLAGLKLPAFLKTDGKSGLHIYIPLDSKSDFGSSKHAAEYLCRLIKVKAGDRVMLAGLEDEVYGKVTLDYQLNEEGTAVIAPYSLVGGSTPNVATPLRWEEITEGLSVDLFNHETIFSRLKKEGDLFEGLFKKKVNADALLERLEGDYGFLF